MRNLLPVTIAVLILSSGCAPTISPRAPAHPNVVAVQRFFDEVLVRGRVDLVDELWTEDMVWHHGALTISDKGAYKDRVRAVVSNPWYGRRLRTIEITPMGDTVVARFFNSTKNVGTFLGGTPTRREGEWHGTATFRLENGRIAEAWLADEEQSVSPRFYASAADNF